MKRTPAFTFVELVVVVAVILALAGIITPYVSRDLSETKDRTAQSDVNRITSAINRYMNDTLLPPTGEQGKRSFHFLIGPGAPPVDNSFNSGDSAPLSAFFEHNTWNNVSWRGPYLEDVGADPWGCAYIVNVEGFWNHAERIFVISAGPDRKLETTPTDVEPKGDDVANIIN